MILLYILFQIEHLCCEPSGIDFVLITASTNGDKPASDRPASDKPPSDKMTSTKKSIGELRKGEHRYMQQIL